MSKYYDWVRFLHVNEGALRANSLFEYQFVDTVLSNVKGLMASDVEMQWEFRDSNNKTRRVDFAVKVNEQIRLAIEVDGYDKRGTGGPMSKDDWDDFLFRQNALLLTGIHLLRFSNRQFTASPSVAIEQIERQMAIIRGVCNIPQIPDNKISTKKQIIRFGVDEDIPHRTVLNYATDKRPWLQNEGFKILDDFVHKCCELVYPLSCKIPMASDETDYVHDIYSPIKFTLFDTDTYPPDGYESIFFSISEPIRNPELKPTHTFSRSISIFEGGFMYAPHHGVGNVSQTKSPRLRKSIFDCKWRIGVYQDFVEGKCTNTFQYSITDSYSLEGRKMSDNLYKLLGLIPVMKKDILKMSGYKKLECDSDYKGIDYEYIYSQINVGNQNDWKGFVDATFKTGWISTEKRSCIIE